MHLQAYLFKDLFYLCVCIYTHVRGPWKARGHKIPWRWSYRWLWATPYRCWVFNFGPLEEQQVLSELLSRLSSPSNIYIYIYIVVLFLFFIRYFLYLHFKCYPLPRFPSENLLFPPPSPCSPTHSLLLPGPGQFSYTRISSPHRTKGLSSHWWPADRPSSATYEAGAMGPSMCTLWLVV